MKTRKGAILGFVVVIFALIIIAVGLIYTTSSTNFGLTRYQLRETEAVYLARTGIELAQSSLIKGYGQAEDNSYFTKYSLGKSKAFIKEDLSSSNSDEAIILGTKDINGNSTHQKRSLWIAMGLASDEENKKLSPNTELGKKYIKLSAKGIIGAENGAGEEVEENGKVHAKNMILFVNLSDINERLLVDPQDQAWDGFDWFNDSNYAGW